MPVLTVEMIEGHSAGQKRELTDVFIRQMARICGCTEEGIASIIKENTKENWAIGGQLLRDR